MMSQIFLRPFIGSMLAMTLGLGTGCSHWIELAPPVDIAPPANATVASDARVPLLLETIRVTHNGSSIAPPSVLERQVLSAIEAPRLFAGNRGVISGRRHRSHAPLLSTLSIGARTTSGKPGARHRAAVNR